MNEIDYAIEALWIGMSISVWKVLRKIERLISIFLMIFGDQDSFEITLKYDSILAYAFN